MKARSNLLYILIFLVLVATLWYIFLAAPASDTDTVPVILPTTAPDDEDKENESSATDGSQLIAVTTDSVQTVIRTLSRADGYSRTISAESFWSGGGNTQNIDVWVRDDAAKLAISRADGTNTKYVLINGGEKWIWYSDSNRVYHGEAAENEADRYQTLLTYEHILELDSGNITDAGYTDYGGSMCIYVRYTSGELGYDSICYISVESGLMMGEESYDGDTLIYRMSSTLPDLSTPEDSVFEHP